MPDRADYIPEHGSIHRLQDEEGNELDLIWLDTLIVDDQAYAVLLDLENASDSDDSDDEDSDDVPAGQTGTIFRVEQGEDGYVFADIEDDDEWSRVLTAWEESCEEVGDDNP
jgi:hypothetical protein